jgi:osmotically-inducible protein OsmY
MIGSDLQLKQHVEDELYWEPSINSAAVGIGVRDAIVTLSGHVDSYAQKHAAGEAVSAIRGVRAVANELEVKLPAESERSDEGIAHAVASIFSWNASIPKNRIHVQVTQGWVTLQGTVDWHYQGILAESLVKDLMGVKGVTNLIAVKSPLPHKDARKRFEDRYRTSEAALESVHIVVDGGAITLTGIVPSLTSKMAIERMAWKTPGVSAVENLLEVAPIEVIELA